MDAFAAIFVNRQSLLFKFWFSPVEKQGYDCFEVWRSMLGDTGPYSELTGDRWGPATVTALNLVSKPVSGKTLKFQSGVRAVDITFVGTDPITLEDMAEQIAYASAGLLVAYGFPSSNLLVVATADVGQRARLQVVGGDAAPIIGFDTTTAFYGTAARPRLTAAHSYTFEDPWGQDSYFYKTRLRRSSDGTVSEFSPPLAGNVTRVVGMDRLILGTIRFADFQGRPVGNRSVMISTKDTIHNSYVDGLVIDASDQVVTTDAQGVASILMLRGIKVSVGIAGTALVRDVTPPMDPTLQSFNLFDPSIATDDAFTVMVPDIAIAERELCT